MPKLYIEVVQESGEKPYIVLSTEQLKDDVDNWSEVGVEVKLLYMGRQPDASIGAGVVRNIFANAGFEVVMV